MNIIAIVLFIILSILNLFSNAKQARLFIIITKVTLAPLAFLNVLLNTSFNSKILLLVTIIYTFYLFGDIFLLVDKPTYFVSGLISFLLGHIVFIFLFSMFIQSKIIILAFLVLLIYPEYLILKMTKKGGALKVPMQIYSLLLIASIAISSMTLNPFFILGTIFFAISDSFIAINVCSEDEKLSDVAVMATYSIALISLSLGLVFLYTTI